MLKVGVLGFGKSFLAWNLAGAVEGAMIYADSRGPYRHWNQSVPVAESWSQIAEAAPRLVVIDHEESVVSPDVVLVIVPPDPYQIDLALQIKKEHEKRTPVHLVLNGYTEGAPWVFTTSFKPLTTIPWDERQASTCMLGMPLVQRDPNFRRYLKPIVEVLFDVDAG